MKRKYFDDREGQYVNAKGIVCNQMTSQSLLSRYILLF